MKPTTIATALMLCIFGAIACFAQDAFMGSWKLILIDNTAEGRGHRVVAQFARAEIVKLARSVPEWAQKAFGKEFAKWLAQEQRTHERAR